MIKLKSLIDNAEKLNEDINWSSFLGGGIAGYITAWATKNKSKKVSSQALDKVALAAQDYKVALDDLNTALAPYAGSTPDEKYTDFLNKLQHISTSHLKPVKPYNSRRRK